jgi:hypothetical protein
MALKAVMCLNCLIIRFCFVDEQVFVLTHKPCRICNSPHLQYIGKVMIDGRDNRSDADISPDPAGGPAELSGDAA